MAGRQGFSTRVGGKNYAAAVARRVHDRGCLPVAAICRRRTTFALLIDEIIRISNVFDD
jgi:hypothetical protein